MGNWTQTFKGWLNFLFESPCPLCQRSTPQSFCQDCQRQIQRCQLSASEQIQEDSPPLFAWGIYGGALKRTIAALKYENQPQLARPLGHWMAQAWLKSGRNLAPAIVVPIPIHRDKRQQRGFNQAELLAQSFCELSGLSLETQGLERTRATEAQFGLSPAERNQNVAGAFILGEAFHRKHPIQPVIVLDDIYTTGATVKAAIQVLQRHSIVVQDLVVLARAQRKS